MAFDFGMRRGSAGAGYSPDYLRQEEELRGQTERQLSDLRHRLRRKGLTGDDINRVTAAPKMQSVGMFKDLLGDEAAYQRAKSAARKARRRGMLGNILGVVGQVIPGIARTRAIGTAASAITKRSELANNILQGILSRRSPVDVGIEPTYQRRPAFDFNYDDTVDTMA